MAKIQLSAMDLKRHPEFHRLLDSGRHEPPPNPTPAGRGAVAWSILWSFVVISVALDALSVGLWRWGYVGYWVGAVSLGIPVYRWYRRGGMDRIRRAVDAMRDTGRS